MKDVEKFFRYLWRFNAVAMAVIGFGCIVAFIVFAVSALWSGPQSDRAGALVTVPARHGYMYSLANDAFRLAGTSEEVFVLERRKGNDASSGARNVNLLVVNGDTAASRWLFGGNGQLILSRDEIHASDIANYNAVSPVTALVLTVVDVGTDGKVAAKDRESLYYYRVGGGGAVRFFAADRILAGRQAGADKYLVIYQDGGAAAAGLFSTYDFRLLAKKTLPQVPE